jgi:hypothetical protein
MHVLKTLNLKQEKKLEIIYDESPNNPRHDDNLTTMVCFHRNYYLGDDTDSYVKEEYDSWDELHADIMKREHPIVIKPLYMYDHSGISISTTEFDCRWDSGQIGYVFITHNDINSLGVTMNDDETWVDYKNRLEGYLDNEVKTYNSYVSGDVYGFRVLDKDGEEEDSCWGFYGDNFRTNGLYDYVGNLMENIDDL